MASTKAYAIDKQPCSSQ